MWRVRHRANGDKLKRCVSTWDQRRLCEGIRTGIDATLAKSNALEAEYKALQEYAACRAAQQKEELNRLKSELAAIQIDAPSH